MTGQRDYVRQLWGRLSRLQQRALRRDTSILTAESWDFVRLQRRCDEEGCGAVIIIARLYHV